MTVKQLCCDQIPSTMNSHTQWMNQKCIKYLLLSDIKFILKPKVLCQVNLAFEYHIMVVLHFRNLSYFGDWHSYNFDFISYKKAITQDGNWTRDKHTYIARAVKISKWEYGL